MVRELILGIYDGLRGATYLARHPRLWVWVILPAIVAVIVLVIVVGWILAALSAPIAALAAYLPGSWADNVLKLIAGVVLAIASVSIFISLAALIAAPFNEELSESIEEKVTGVAGPKFRLGRFLIDLLIGIAHAARRVSIYLVVMGTLLVVGLVVPVIGTVAATVLGAIATARFASYDAFDAVFARRRYRYRQKTQYLTENRWRSLGMGGVVAVLLVIPGLNVIGLSIGATAATLRLIEQERDQRSRTSRDNKLIASADKP
ncbi:MAG TPA: EI24 domain-containing protein [Kofleriaceae bacterium]